MTAAALFWSPRALLCIIPSQASDARDLTNPPPFAPSSIHPTNTIHPPPISLYATPEPLPMRGLVGWQQPKPPGATSPNPYWLWAYSFSCPSEAVGSGRACCAPASKTRDHTAALKTPFLVNDIDKQFYNIVWTGQYRTLLAPLASNSLGTNILYLFYF